MVEQVFGLLIMPRGTVLQRRWGRSPAEPISQGQYPAYRLVTLDAEAIAVAMIRRGHRVLDGGWSYNRTETGPQLQARVARNLVAARAERSRRAAAA